jgi:hypothetical protein
MRTFVGYLLVGLLLALLCDRKLEHRTPGARVGSALLSLSTWPLWVPLAFLGKGPPLTESSLTQRVRAALEEARRAVAGTTLAALLPEELLARSQQGLLQVERRHAELCALLVRPEFRNTADGGAHAENVRRLHLLEQRDRRVLGEMAELAEALRTQLLVARYSGRDSEGEGAKGLVTDLSTRVESMDAWFELEA